MSIKPNVCDFRGNLCENMHFASIVVCSKTGDIVQMFPHSDKHLVFLRSAAKPLQAFPLYQNPLSKDTLLDEWAIICASHAATQTQLDLVQKVLDKANATIQDLQCGPHLPVDETMAQELLCRHEQPTAIHNNCSGKHAGMLYACKLYGWPIETYLNIDHPLQQAILKTVKTYSGAPDIDLAIDGCGAPVFGMPLQHMAQLYAQFSSQPEFKTLRKAMTTFPEIIGDRLRIDTLLMQVSEGNLVAKVGAEGVLGIGNQATEEGLAIKVHEGNNPIRDRLIIAILEDLGWISTSQADFLWQQPQFSKARTNTQGKLVGYYAFSLDWLPS